jgi:hypothetical protein
MLEQFNLRRIAVVLSALGVSLCSHVAAIAATPGDKKPTAAYDAVKRYKPELLTFPGVKDVYIGERPNVIAVLVEEITPQLKREMPYRIDGWPVVLFGKSGFLGEGELFGSEESRILTNAELHANDVLHHNTARIEAFVGSGNLKGADVEADGATFVITLTLDHVTPQIAKRLPQQLDGVPVRIQLVSSCAK